MTIQTDLKSSEQQPWDYSRLAATYDLRPDYCPGLVDEILRDLSLTQNACVLEVGAGTGKLTGLLCAFGLDVIALEPNLAMRSAALNKPSLHGARWIAARGESLPFADRSMSVIAYGSSFNVLPAQAALAEAARVLRPGGWWLALWNHRDLAGPLQQAVEAAIHRHLPDYAYGQRRMSPAAAVAAHPSFRDLRAFERRFVVAIGAADWLRAWESHATLQRQAGTRLSAILADLETLVGTHGTLRIPYATRAWTAERVRG